MFRQCPICRSLFFPKSKTHWYCSERCRRAADNRSEKGRARKRRYEESGRRPKRPYIPAFERRFVAWDGEGIEDRYIILANSDGRYIVNEQGLSTEECLEFLLEYAGKPVNHVWFAFGYDVAMMLGASIPLEAESGGSLRELHENGETRWNDYIIRYIPRKMFQVTHLPTRRTFTSWDAHGFFQTSFLGAAREWLGDVPELVERGKAAREEFSTWELEDILRYNAEECRLLVDIMIRLREALRAAGLKVSRWDGAGAVAAAWLKSQNAGQWYGKIPEDMIEPLATAYFGGRNELAATGWGRVYHYDLNNAYPSALSMAPDLSKLSWRRVKRPELDKLPDFSIVRVRWELRPSDHGGPGQWNPFPWRTPRGQILFPYSGRGWYWTVEVKAAARRFRKVRLPWLELEEAWVPEGEWAFPWRDRIQELYELRRQWKAEGNPAQIPLKLVLNSLYGKMAQKVSRQKERAPAWRNMALAGWITAVTRARISDALDAAGGWVVCVMTDGIWSLRPIDHAVPIGKGLGEWSFEPEDEYGAFCGAGLYEAWSRDGRRRQYKQRGFGGLDVSFRELARYWLGEPGAKAQETRFQLRRFVGIGLALHSELYRRNFRRFVAMERELQPVPVVGTTKRLPAAYGGTKRPGKGGKWLWLMPIDRPADILDSTPYAPGLWELHATEEEKVDRLAQECEE